MALNSGKKALSNNNRTEPSPRPKPDFPIVGIGASAGGIEAFTALLKNLSEAPGLSFVFVLHQDPKHTSNLAQIVARATQMPAEVVQPGTAARKNHVYIAPADAEVSIVNGVLHLHERPTGAPSVIDGFLRSLAQDQGSRAISVILSGSGTDGAVGTKAIKAEDGITFAQDATAKVDSMPRSAAAAGLIDFVLSPKEIANELMRIAQHDYVGGGSKGRLPEEDLLKLFALIQSKHDIDFRHYKPGTVERRIRRRMSLHRVNTLAQYLPLIRQNPSEAEQLYADILIRVTGFFRDPQVFESLHKEVFPQILRNRRDDETVRVWVPGCATGEEVYSIAIAMLETISGSGYSCPAQIFGTDVSELAIDRARAATYPESVTSEVSPERLRRFFNPANGGYRVSKAVRDCCIFARQNVTTDPPFSKLDLISCRNVMIYFGSVLQKQVVSIFHYALRPGGFLLLGSAETIGSFGELFEMVDRKNKIYRKKTIVGRPNVEFSLAAPQPAAERFPVEEDVPGPNALFREADRILLSRFGPAGVLVNEDLDVLQFRGRTSRFLEPPPGTATFNLLKMAREGLLADLRGVIHIAKKKNAPERREGIRVSLNDHTITVNIEAIPFVTPLKERFVLVLFEEAPEKKSRRKEKVRLTPPMSRLRRELEATREYLQSIIEEQEAMNEELRSANEEIQSSNEELQSTNEELETAKEELQSSNEELTTLNEELENSNQELAVVNNDLVNLLASIEIPIVMLDGALRMRRFNPAAQRLLNFIPSDLGRSINDINTKLRIDNLEALIREVIETLEVREVEVKDRAGRWQSLRIRPYKTTDNKIDGAVLALVSLDEFRRTSLPAES
jgi:two-component system CheB/CheR fusion protein